MPEYLIYNSAIGRTHKFSADNDTHAFSQMWTCVIEYVDKFDLGDNEYISVTGKNFTKVARMIDGKIRACDRIGVI